jgi:hypothetical protein
MSAVTLVSPLARAECVRRLRAALPGEPQGRVRDDGAVLRAQINYRNSFQLLLRLAMKDNAQGGTDLVCDFGMSRIVVAFMAAWFAFNILLGAFGFVSGFSWSALGQILLLPLIGIAGIALGRYIGRHEKDELIDYLIFTLDARRT